MLFPPTSEYRALYGAPASGPLPCARDNEPVIWVAVQSKKDFDLIRKTSSGAQHLRWEGDGYVEADEDPFTKVQLDILD